MISKRDILKIESLLFLQAISEAGSKREVAGQLGTSVDTLNKYLSEFEAEMKTKFLISNGRGTVITPEGKRMLDIAQDVVRAVRSMGRLCRRGRCLQRRCPSGHAGCDCRLYRHA